MDQWRSLFPEPANSTIEVTENHRPDFHHRLKSVNWLIQSWPKNHLYVGWNNSTYRGEENPSHPFISPFVGGTHSFITPFITSNYMVPYSNKIWRRVVYYEAAAVVYQLRSLERRGHKNRKNNCRTRESTMEDGGSWWINEIPGYLVRKLTVFFSEKLMVGRCIFYWKKSLFRGDLLVFRAGIEYTNHKLCHSQH